jgi:hypothetical protein
MKQVLGTALALSILATSALATAQVTPADCEHSTRFKGKKPAFVATEKACARAKFFDGGKLPNPPVTGKNFKRLPVCLGFGPDIDSYLASHPGKCRRLDSSAWTEGLNMSFVDCVAKGFLGPKPIWVTKPSAVRKSADGKWKTLVTFAEMCRNLKVHKNWIGRTVQVAGGKRTAAPKRAPNKPQGKPAKKKPKGDE